MDGRQTLMLARVQVAGGSTGLASTQREAIAIPTVVGLVAAIAVIDVVANVVVPEPARVPVKLVILVVLVAWAHRSAGLGWDELGLERARLGAGLRLGCVAAAVVVAAIVVFVAIPGSRSFFESDEVAADSTTRHVLMPLVIIPLGTALFEEMIFRGVLLGVLLRAAKRHTAVVVSAVLFGLWHLPAALGDAKHDSAIAAIGVVGGTIAVTSGAGVLFAWLRLSSGSLAAPVLAHVATNSVTYGAALFVLSV